MVTLGEGGFIGSVSQVVVFGESLLPASIDQAYNGDFSQIEDAVILAWSGYELTGCVTRTVRRVHCQQQDCQVFDTGTLSVSHYFIAFKIICIFYE